MRSFYSFVRNAIATTTAVDVVIVVAAVGTPAVQGRRLYRAFRNDNDDDLFRKERYACRSNRRVYRPTTGRGGTRRERQRRRLTEAI